MSHNSNEKQKVKEDTMNRFIGTGTLPKAGVINGSGKNVLRFTLATVTSINPKTKKVRVSYVPCVAFRPSEETVKLLTENTDGMLIGLEGRINTSKYESDGKTKYSTDVVVDEKSIQLLDLAKETKEGKLA